MHTDSYVTHTQAGLACQGGGEEVLGVNQERIGPPYFSPASVLGHLQVFTPSELGSFCVSAETNKANDFFWPKKIAPGSPLAPQAL